MSLSEENVLLQGYGLTGAGADDQRIVTQGYSAPITGIRLAARAMLRWATGMPDGYQVRRERRWAMRRQ